MSDDDTHDPNDLDALVGRVDPDRWLSSRFISDAQARAAVIALYAFDHELARAPRVATNPLMGEIRLTWWNEVLDEVFEGRPVRKHPTALALAAAIGRHGLARPRLEAMIDARYRELSAEPMKLGEALEWADGTAGNAAVVAAKILDPQADEGKAMAGGRAWAIGRLIGTAGLAGPDVGPILERALQAAGGLSVPAFPAIAHATLARLRAKRRKPSDLEARLRLFLAVARGKV
ncbi:phytoene/squalene synthase family protein [soil metagenome]